MWDAGNPYRQLMQRNRKDVRQSHAIILVLILIGWQTSKSFFEPIEFYTNGKQSKY